MRPHAYCLMCGQVRNLGGPMARKMGFYLSGLSAQKESLSMNVKYRKMTQSHFRLIVRSLASLEQFEDPFGLTLSMQTQLYLGSVKRVRPDLDNELILRLSPQVRGRLRWPLGGKRA